MTEGQVVGIDHSETMLYQASKHNVRAIAEGRVQLNLGSVDALPDFKYPIDKIFSANVVQFWNDPVKTFEVRGRLLAHNGVIATTYTPRRRGATDADTDKKSNGIVNYLTQAGFPRLRLKKTNEAGVSCMRARNKKTEYLALLGTNFTGFLVKTRSLRLFLQ